MRDKHRNLEYFNTCIADSLKTLSLCEAYIGKAATPRHKEGLLEYRIITSITFCSELYSAGKEKGEIMAAYLDGLRFFCEDFKWKGFAKHYGGYDIMVWFVSIGILLDIEDADFSKLCEAIKRNNAKDWILDKLIHSRIPSWELSSTFIQKEPYQFTQNIFDSKGIREYLKKRWYKGHRDAAWHESHKLSGVFAYFGYWSWESAALVKVLGINDYELKELDFYPYDAAHWNDPLV
jgi:hypothetical protein